MTELPADLPRPVDDGAARHLPGLALPDLALPATSGLPRRLSALGRAPGRPRTVLYLYPMTGRPGVALPEGWDTIPGARGCTPEACGFRDHHADIAAAGADVYGLSSQTTEEQREAAERLRLPFPLLSDPDLTLAGTLRLPTFVAAGVRRYARLTLIVEDGAVAHAFYPVFPPDTHAEEVLSYLRGRMGA